MTDLATAAVTLRTAMPADIAALETLIAASARALGRGFYSDEQIEAAIAHVFGVDSELVADGTYLVAFDAEEGTLLGCGGWSRRTTLFGGDRYRGRAVDWLDPVSEAARIRAFFVTPSAARRGVGSQLLAACEERAAAADFSAAALMATLPGVPFYAAHGYAADATLTLDLNGVVVPFVPMRKDLTVRRNSLSNTLA